MSTVFRPATREKSKLRMAIDGVSGSGKTFTALRFATAAGKRIAVINSESGAVEKYLGLAPDGIPFAFDICTLDDFAPSKFTEAILAAGRAGYDVIIIDSLSHAWAGAGGALELKDRKSVQSKNSFTAWKDITPMHNQMIEAIIRSPCHVIATMRSKTEYILETDGRGRSVPRKVGTAPVQRAGMEYEFDLYCSLDDEHVLRVSKSRCPEVASGDLVVKPGVSFMEPVTSWLNDGSDAPAERFAVTEADLKRFEQRVAADQPKQPAKSAQELMAEASAKAAAPAPVAAATPAATQPPATQPTAAQPATTTATTPATPNTSLGPTPAQIARLDQLYSQAGITAEQQTAILAKRNVDSVERLTAGQATQIIANLQAAVTNAATQGGQPAAGNTGIGEHEPCTDDQVADIKAALTDWETTQPGVSADFVARLNGAGFVKIANLTFGQARALLADIEAKQMANFFESQLETAAAG